MIPDEIFTFLHEYGTANENLVIVELKQWTEMQFSLLEDHVKTILGGAWQEPRHPSYQAWSYKTQLDQFNEYVYGNSVDVTACAYLHNCKSLEVIADTKYDKLLSLAPVFIHGQSRDLVNLISSKILFTSSNISTMTNFFL